MKVWFDTEFHETKTSVELISIGMVNESGDEYYAETNFFDEAAALKNEFLAENVLPKLVFDPSERKSRDQIASDILQFMIMSGPNPELWAYYATTDFYLLYRLYGRLLDLPSSIPRQVNDIKTFSRLVGSPLLPPKPAGNHNALEDARWNRLAFYHIEKRWIR